MSPIIETVKMFLDAEAMNYFEKEGKLFLPMAHELAQWHAWIHVPHDINLVCNSVFPLRAPAHRRADVARALMRFNWHVIVGNWEMDFDTGIIHYKTGVNLEDVQLTPEMVRNICQVNFSTFGDCLEDILAVIVQDRPAEEIQSERDAQRAKDQAGFEDAMHKLGFTDEEFHHDDQ